MAYFYSEVLAYAVGIIVLRGQRNKKNQLSSMAFFLMAITIGAISLQAIIITQAYQSYDSLHILILFIRQMMLLLIYHLVYEDDWLTCISVASMTLMTVAFSKLLFEVITFIPSRLPIKGIYIENDGIIYHGILVMLTVFILKYLFKLRVDLIQRQEQHYIISLMGVNLWIFSLLGSYFAQQLVYNVNGGQLSVIIGFTSILALFGVKFIIEKSGEVLLVSQYEDLERYLPALYETLIESKRSTVDVIETMLFNPLAKENLVLKLREIDFYDVNLCRNSSINAFILMNYLQLKKQGIHFQTELLVTKEISYKKLVHIFGMVRRCLDYLSRVIMVDNDKRMICLYLYEQCGSIVIEFAIESTTRRERMIEVSMNSLDSLIGKDYQQLNEYVHIHDMEHRFTFDDNGIKLSIKARKAMTFAGIKIYEN